MQLLVDMDIHSILLNLQTKQSFQYLPLLVFLIAYSSVNAAKSGPVYDYIRAGRVCQRSTRISPQAAANLMRFRISPANKKSFIDFDVCMFKALGLFDENGEPPNDLEQIEKKIPEKYQDKVSVERFCKRNNIFLSI